MNDVNGVSGVCNVNSIDQDARVYGKERRGIDSLRRQLSISASLRLVRLSSITFCALRT